MDSDEPQQTAVGESAGQQLKRARESRGLSQKDVADAQHLRVSIIQAIEDGNYDQIDSELFLKGYVRTYAKQVGADADALIQTLDLELEPMRKERDKQAQENPLVDIERRRRKKRRIAKVLGWLVLLGGIAFAGWKLILEPGAAGVVAESTAVDSTESTGAPINDDAPEDDAAPDDEAPEDSDLNGSDQESGQSSPLEIAPDSEASLAPEPEDGQAINANDETQTSLVEEPDATADVSGLDESSASSGIQSSGSTDLDDLSAGDETVVQPDPVFEESAQPQSLAAQTQLEMSFVSDCWVQVTDSSGERLVASLQREGDRISVAGRAPMQVVIGAVDAVDTVRFAGEPVNLSGFRIVNNRTEFTLTL